MSKPIQEYLPFKSKDLTMIQGRVPTEIISKVKKIMEKDNLSWAELLTACLRHFVDEKSVDKVTTRKSA